MPIPSYVIFVNGGYGVGKSSTLDHIGDLLAGTGKAFSLMDVDWFHRSWPPAADDPENVRTEAENMTVVWNNYLRAGPRQPVVAGVIASGRDQERYASAFELPVRSVRLTASAGVTEARLRRRYTEHQANSLTWHLKRHADLTQRQALADLDFGVAPPRCSPRSMLTAAGPGLRRTSRSTPTTVMRAGSINYQVDWPLSWFVECFPDQG